MEEILEELVEVDELEIIEEYQVEIDERSNEDYDPISSGVSWFLDNEEEFGV